MASFADDDGDVLTIRSVPALRMALGWGLATACLIHVVFELLQAPAARHQFRTSLQLAILSSAASCMASRWVTLRFDRRSRVLQRRSFGAFGIRRRAFPFNSIRTVELSGIHALPGLGLEWLGLVAEGRVVRIGPLSWLNVSRTTRHNWLEAIRQTVSPKGSESTEFRVHDEEPSVRFSLRRVVIAVSLSALVLGSSRWAGVPIQSQIVLMALAAGCPLLVTTRARCYALLLILIVCYTPFAWVIRASVPWGHTSGMIGSLPMAPATWFAFPLAIAGIHPDSGFWIGLIAPFQVLGVTWLASRSARWMLGMAIGSFVLAAAGSFFFYCGYRM
jgi:hypothetical protein